MAAIVENWTDLDGQVQSVAPAADVANHVMVVIRVRRVQAVEGFANLLAKMGGRDLKVHVASDVAERAGLAPGVQVHCRIRRAGPERLFAHPTETRVE